MKIAILANERRKAKDKPIIEEAEKAFDTVIYAPIRKVRFDLVSSKASRFSSKRFERGIHVKFEDNDLSEADCLLPIPTKIKSELFYTALWMLDGCLMPFDADTYMSVTTEHMLFNYLKLMGLPIRESLVVASNVSLGKIDERVKYPVIVRPPRKRVMVTNKQTLKDVLSLYKFGVPILIEKPIKPERNVWVFVLGDEVIASYEKVKTSPKATAVDDDVKKLAIKAREFSKCDYCAMRFLLEGDDWIIDRFTVSPNFSNFKKITGVNIGRHIASHLLNKAVEVERPSWQKKIEEIFRFDRLKDRTEEQLSKIIEWV